MWVGPKKDPERKFWKKPIEEEIRKFYIFLNLKIAKGKKIQSLKLMLILLLNKIVEF